MEVLDKLIVEQLELIMVCLAIPKEIQAVGL
jgi:hypothetical protein